MTNQTVVRNAALQTKDINFDITYCPVRAQGTINGSCLLYTSPSPRD